MIRSAVNLKSSWLAVPFLFLILLLSANLGVLSARGAEGAKPPREISQEFHVGISAFEPGTAEQELSTVIQNELRVHYFNADLINMNSSSAQQILDEYPYLDFFVIVDVVGGENRPFIASVYSRHFGDMEIEEFKSATQAVLSENVSDYISGQATLVHNSSEPEDLYTAGLKQFDDKNYEAAVETFNDKLSEDGADQWRIHYYLSRSYRELGNAEKQLEHILAGLDLAPENEYLLITEANYYYRAKEYKTAAEKYKALLNAPNNAPAARYNLAISYKGMGEISRAIETLTAPNADWGDLVEKKNNLYFNLKGLQRTDQIRKVVGALAILIILITLAYMINKRYRRKLQIQTWTNSGDASELALKNELLQTLNAGMNTAELKELCFGLGLDWDNLSGDTKQTRVISLIEYFANRDDLRSLQEAIGRYRPDLILDPAAAL